MLDPTAKALAQGPNLAALTTLLPEGQPSTQLVWVDADDAHLMVNTEIGRQKYRNVQRDPRVALTVIDSANPYLYTEVRGRVVGTVTGAEARAHIDRLSQKYTGAPYSRPIASERVILQIEPERVYSPEG
jgi:PPOX class probable F420-dependent enzyme